MPTFENCKEGCFAALRRKNFLDLFSSESAVIRKLQHICHVMYIESEYMGVNQSSHTVILLSNISNITVCYDRLK
jgi:hypothetical protein